MKNIIIAIILTGFAFNAKAQSTICPSINAFAGEWRYVNGQDTLKIYLRPSDYTVLGVGSPTPIAKLWGWHEYKKGNTVIESNYSNRFIALPANSQNNTVDYSVSLQMPECDDNRQKLIGYINDITQCMELKSVAIIFNAAKTQLTWLQRHSEGFGYISGCKGMTLPGNLVLTKQ